MKAQNKTFIVQNFISLPYLAAVIVGITILFLLTWFFGSPSGIPLSGQAIYAGDLSQVQYLNLSKNVQVSGSDYRCSTHISSSCWLAGERIKRTYTFGGRQLTGTYKDGCQYAVGKWRSNDYGCLGTNAIYCWKYCDGGDLSCNRDTGMCSGDVYVPPPVVYDDFSGPSLDSSKWIITRDDSGVGGDLPTEYYLDTTTKNFHTAQREATERGIILTSTRQFQPGEVLDYDVTYVSGSGNHMSRIFVNGIPFRPSDDVAIGYWNEPYPAKQNWGDVTGKTVHWKAEFLDGSVTVTLTVDDKTYIRTVTGLAAPYTIGVNSRTGHNGLFEFDYDNFVIS